MENKLATLNLLTKGVFSSTCWKQDNFWNMKLMVRSPVLKAKKAERVPAIRTKFTLKAMKAESECSRSSSRIT